MRRLLTGYAVTFNLRRKRAGHLFQNRYKSVVCEEEPYLLELVRYIHLNPIRAGLVNDMEQLDKYRWCGHSVLLGRETFQGQNTDEVLMYFGSTVSRARTNYRAFVADGLQMGRRTDLAGGGLKRSLQLDGSRELRAYDQRILGTGPFVETLKKQNQIPRPHVTAALDAIIDRIASFFGLTLDQLAERTRKKTVGDARAAISYVAVRQMGHDGMKVAERLNITRSGVSIAANRGEMLVEADKSLRDLISKLTG